MAILSNILHHHKSKAAAVSPAETPDTFDLEAYAAAGVEGLVKDIIKASIFCPEEGLFMAKFAVTAKNANEKRHKLNTDGTHIPPFLIASITSVCNLHCAGCYARSLSTCEDGETSDQMNAEEWGSVFRQARDLGICFILLAGGEPMVRRDVLEQATQIPEIIFPVFTNGTILDESALQLFDHSRNLVPVISLEGNEEQTDRRRGKGVYHHLMDAAEQMRSRHILMGCSITVTRENYEDVTDAAFIKDLTAKGFRVFIFVEYVPMSRATEALAPDESCREAFNVRLMDLRKTQDHVLFIAFPGDETSTSGCLAAGRGFFHINSHGGAEPCPFSPYSDVNLKNASLMDAVQSPLFTSLQNNGMLLEDHQGGCVLFPQKEKVKELLLSTQ